MTNEESDKEIDELLKESSQNEQSNVLGQSEIDELVKENSEVKENLFI